MPFRKGFRVCNGVELMGAEMKQFVVLEGTEYEAVHYLCEDDGFVVGMEGPDLTDAPAAVLVRLMKDIRRQTSGAPGLTFGRTTPPPMSARSRADLIKAGYVRPMPEKPKPKSEQQEALQCDG